MNLNSIVFTAIMKGFMNRNKFDDTIEFFNQIKEMKDLPGMIITYNCALDSLVRREQINEAVSLFAEIDQKFGADLISFSTLVKGLCSSNRKT